MGRSARLASVLARRALLVAWLVVVWLLLWGRVSVTVVLSGVVVAVVAAWAARLPRLPLTTRVRWVRVPGLVARSTLDIARSAWAVAVATGTTGRRTRSSVLGLDIPPGASDAALLLACNRITLEPGTSVIDVDPERGRLFVYQLGTPDEAAAGRARAQSQRLLDDVVATFPAREEGEAR